MNALTVSVVLLWVAVIALAVLTWALSRQVGVLFERVAPMGALVTDSGPAVGSASPMFELTGIQSERVEVGMPSATPSLVFFLSPSCPVCKKLLPVLKSLRRDEKKRLRVVLAVKSATSRYSGSRTCMSSASRCCGSPVLPSIGRLRVRPARSACCATEVSR